MPHPFSLSLIPIRAFNCSAASELAAREIDSMHAVDLDRLRHDAVGRPTDTLAAVGKLGDEHATRKKALDAHALECNEVNDFVKETLVRVEWYEYLISQLTT